MIEHELLLLGLLRESPKHGYDIKRKIQELFSLFAGINLKSIYYPLKVLEKKGLVVKRASKSGRRPERFVYALTQKGEARFSELLTKSLLDFKRPQFSLNLSLYFLNYMKPDIVKRRLRARRLVLENLAKDLRHTLGSFRKKGVTSLVYVLEHDLQMVVSERRFLSNFIKHF